MRNLAEMFFRTTRELPDKPAATFQDTTLSWGELYQRVDLLRHHLAQCGIRRGDVVAIYGEHNLSQIVAILAVVASDAAFQIVNTAIREDQILHQISDSNAMHVIGEAGYVKMLGRILESRRIGYTLLTPEGLMEGSEPLESDYSVPDFPTLKNIPADVSNIIYTSGSTGRSKGVVVPHRVLLDGARIVSGYLGIRKEDVILSILPFSFDYGLNQLMTCIYTGARIVLHTFAFPRDFVAVIAREGVTGVAGVPSLWPHFFNPKMIDQNAGKALTSLRYITTAGGPHSEKLLGQLHAFFPSPEIIIMYGLTESFRSTYLPFSEVFKRIGSIGKAVPEVEILVLDDNGDPCPPGHRGELVHRGAFITYGYLNNEDLTRSKFIDLQTGRPGCLPEKAVLSGDLVSLDEDGFIYYHGRIDAQIKSYGYRISPSEIEDAAMAFTGLSHAAAFGIQDEVSGQMVCLAYSTYSSTPVDETRFQQHLKKHLPTYAIPRMIFHRQQMPTTPSGKIDYPALRASVQS